MQLPRQIEDFDAESFSTLSTPRGWRKAAMDVFNIEVKRDFLERLTRAQPIAAIAEMIWNSLDADATRVVLKSVDGDVGVDRLEITDNGSGIAPDHALDVFKQLGGSWKQIGGGYAPWTSAASRL
jgi:Histidine kinase-, DNA gyrase B-, and HSP90-like ATPase